MVILWIFSSKGQGPGMLLRCTNPSEVSSHILTPAGMRSNYVVFFSTVSVLSLRMQPEYGCLKSLTWCGPGPHTWMMRGTGTNRTHCSTHLQYSSTISIRLPVIYVAGFPPGRTNDNNLFWPIISPPPFCLTQLPVCAYVVCSTVDDRSKSAMILPSR